MMNYKKLALTVAAGAMATTMMAVSHTGRGHHLKLVRIISAKVFAFTAIQLTADRAISTDMMAELRLPRKLRARTRSFFF